MYILVFVERVDVTGMQGAMLSLGTIVLLLKNLPFLGNSRIAAFSDKNCDIKNNSKAANQP